MIFDLFGKGVMASWPAIYRVFGPVVRSEKPIFDFFGRDQKDARRKVMQIRGGITSGSAFSDRFMPL